MRTTSKLGLVAALTLVTMALAAGPAYAVNAVATENGPGNLDNGVISITCTSMDIGMTLDGSGGGTIDSLTFGGCTNDVVGAACSLTVTGLPQAFRITTGWPGCGRLHTDRPAVPRHGGRLRRLDMLRLT
jgi:hypothetical protein